MISFCRAAHFWDSSFKPSKWILNNSSQWDYSLASPYPTGEKRRKMLLSTLKGTDMYTHSILWRIIFQDLLSIPNRSVRGGWMSHEYGASFYSLVSNTSVQREKTGRESFHNMLSSKSELMLTWKSKPWKWIYGVFNDQHYPPQYAQHTPAGAMEPNGSKYLRTPGKQNKLKPQSTQSKICACMAAPNVRNWAHSWV